MNKEIIESLEFIKDNNFELEQWIKPYLLNSNILSFIKFKSEKTNMDFNL